VGACQLLSERVNKVVCLHQPFYFFAVGAFYLDFHQVTDDEVEGVLQKTREERPGLSEVCVTSDEKRIPER